MSLCIFDSSAMAWPDSYGLSEAGFLPIITRAVDYVAVAARVYFFDI